MAEDSMNVSAVDEDERPIVEHGRQLRDIAVERRHVEDGRRLHRGRCPIERGRTPIESTHVTTRPSLGR